MIAGKEIVPVGDIFEHVNDVPLTELVRAE